MGNSQPKSARDNEVLVPKKRMPKSVTASSIGKSGTGNSGLKSLSCFNFAHSVENPALLDTEAPPPLPPPPPVTRRRHPGLLTKVRQRIVKLNRRSTPIETASKSSPMPPTRSLTDYNLINLKDTYNLASYPNSLDDLAVPPEKPELPELPEPPRKIHAKKPQPIVRFGTFTKSPALYNLKSYTEDEPGAAEGTKITDLLEDKESLSSYEETAEPTAAPASDSMSPSPSSSSTRNDDAESSSSSAHSSDTSFLSSSTISTPSSISSTSESETPAPPFKPPSLVDEEESVDDTKPVSILLAADFSFIDDGQSELDTTSCSESSLRSSHHSPPPEPVVHNVVPSVKQRSATISSSTPFKFITEVNKKLMFYANNRKKKLLNESMKHSETKKETSSSSGGGDGYSEGYTELKIVGSPTGVGYEDIALNDNVSLYTITYLRRKAPLASSETTTLSNSNDNLVVQRKRFQL